MVAAPAAVATGFGCHDQQWQGKLVTERQLPSSSMTAVRTKWVLAPAATLVLCACSERGVAVGLQNIMLLKCHGL
jgi:hypothetical protein